MDLRIPDLVDSLTGWVHRIDELETRGGGNVRIDL
jgi:hypothetical protein